MESQSPSPASSREADYDHQLASGRSPLGRLQNHAQGLSKDLRSWVELRIELAKIEFWERADEKANQVAVAAVAGVLGALAGLFALLTLAFGLSWAISALTGWTLGALFFGFLIVVIILASIAGLIFSAQPHLGLVPEKRKSATVSEERVMRSAPSGRRRSGSTSAAGNTSAAGSTSAG